ncbi:MAG: hypothetical protein WCC36_07720 [Gammaproteobacteria bacterium]
MPDDDPKLSIMSDEELEASLHPEGPAADASADDKTYEGPEHRTGDERRTGPRDRREMVRFEPDKERADRRSGKDRRKANNKPEDIWNKRDF